MAESSPRSFSEVHDAPSEYVIVQLQRSNRNVNLAADETQLKIIRSR